MSSIVILIRGSPAEQGTKYQYGANLGLGRPAADTIGLLYNFPRAVIGIGETI